MPGNWTDTVRNDLCAKKSEIEARLERIKANLRRGLETDSKERAKQLEDQEVVDALGNDARQELGQIASALKRIDAGAFDVCNECGGPIGRRRLQAWPYATECIDCARQGQDASAQA